MHLHEFGTSTLEFCLLEDYWRERERKANETWCIVLIAMLPSPVLDVCEKVLLLPFFKKSGFNSAHLRIVLVLHKGV